MRARRMTTRTVLNMIVLDGDDNYNGDDNKDDEGLGLGLQRGWVEDEEGDNDDDKEHESTEETSKLYVYLLTHSNENYNTFVHIVCNVITNL